MGGFSRPSSSSKSCGRGRAEGANGNFSSTARPSAPHRGCFQRLPSFIASACNWFMIRVRICTSRCRCQSSCRRSRFSGLGTQMRGKRFSSSNFSNSWASWRSVFCLRTRLALISAALPIHTSIPSSTSKRVRKRSEEHTPELQSPDHLLCRLLLEHKQNPLQLLLDPLRLNDLLHTH